MENVVLTSLLLKNRVDFHWSEISRTWLLTDQIESKDHLDWPPSQPAVSLEAAQSAAIRFIQGMHQPDYNNAYNDSSELDVLLNKYRLTFNWGNPGLRWWLVGQNKGSNALLRTTTRPAKDIETAKADAVQYILRTYQPSATEIES